MTRLTSTTLVLIVVLVIDAVANAQQWQDLEGWNGFGLFAFTAWLITLFFKSESA